MAFEDQATPFAKAVLTALKGPEAELPLSFRFRDIRNHERTAIRLNWWRSSVQTWCAAALSLTNPTDLPDTPVMDVMKINFYKADQKPVFFGHYKRVGQPVLESSNDLCLDYHHQPCAYRGMAKQSQAAND